MTPDRRNMQGKTSTNRKIDHTTTISARRTADQRRPKGRRRNHRLYLQVHRPIRRRVPTQSRRADKRAAQHTDGGFKLQDHLSSHRGILKPASY
jgi:hypothetical protein